MISLSFHGAAQEVTGSLHLLDVNSNRIALDCGLYQGRRAEANRRNTTHPCDPGDIDAVILSHAHIDHSGKLPRLVKDGFSGAVYATPATRDLCALMLADSAHIQEEDAYYINKKRLRRGDPPVEPIYTSQDAVRTVALMHAVSYGRWFHVVPDVRARFFDAGHILGSAGVEIEINSNGRPHRKLVFTGDMGRFDTPILRDPAPLPPCDYLICESTYGGRRTGRAADLKDQLEAVLQKTFERRGKVIIPAFSVGRTQNVVYHLAQLMQENRIKRVPVYIDSPLSVSASEIFKLHPECYDEDALAFQTRAGDILGADCCTYVRDVEESKKIHRRRSPCVIISASGMCEVGRILHHLKNNIRSARNTILIVGYQAAHTLGRRLVEREPKVRIFGQRYRVKAEVKVLNGFSAHADMDELARLTSPVGAGCRQAFVVHGEPDQSAALQRTMSGNGFGRVEVPQPGETFTLD